MKKKMKLWKELLLRFVLSIVGGFLGFNTGGYIGSLLGINYDIALFVVGATFAIIFAYAFGYKIAGIFLGEN